MKKFCALFMIVFIPLLITAQTEGVIKTIPSPSYSYGLTYDGTNLWVGTSSTNSNQIWKIDPADGSVLGSITVPFEPPSGSYTVKGLAYDGQNLWVFMDLPSANHPDKFYKVDPQNGNVLKTINCPTNNYIGGMAYADDHIWFSSYYSGSSNYNNTLVKLDTNGTFVNSFATQGEQPMGVAYDGRFVWCAEDTGYGATRQEIYKYDPDAYIYTGEFIRNPDNSPRDMAYDGNYFWLIGYYSNVIYQIDPAGGTPTITINIDHLNFGLTVIDSIATRTFNILNTGDAPLIVDSLYFSNSDFYSESTTPMVIDPNSAQQISIKFTTPDYGISQGILQIKHNDPTEPDVIINLKGTGLYPDPTIGFTLGDHNFGPVWIATEGNATWKMDIINRGIQTLEVDSFSTKSREFNVISPDFPFQVIADDTVFATVLFTPDQQQVYNDTITLYTNDPANPECKITVRGEGVLENYSYGYQFWSYQVPDNPDAGSYQEYEVDGLVSVNDLTGDGTNEIVIATENYWLMCLNGAASGMSDTLWTFSSYISNYSAGSIGANLDYGVQDAIDVADDLNGDGFNDVVIATGGGNEHVYAIDGTNGNILWQYGTDDPGSYGLGDFEAVEAKRDFNGDGVVDVLAIADGNEQGTGYKSAYLFNGSTGTVFWSYPYPGPNLSFGKTIISLDDLNNDNVPDAAIAVGNNSTSDLKVYGLDGATGFPLWDFPVLEWNPKELLELKIPGETPDIIVARYFDNIYRIDGETGIQMWQYIVPGGLAGVIQMDLIPDLDNDGIEDILIASFSPALVCISGENGQLIWSYPMQFQYGVSYIPDLNNDGIDDVIAGDGDNDGTIYAISGKGDSLFFSHTFTDTRVISVNVMPSIDGNASWEFVAATRDGQVVCFSGGLEAVITNAFDHENITKSFELLQNYPNPFNPRTTIEFNTNKPGKINLQIYNTTGQQVAELLTGKWLPEGRHFVHFDAGHLPSGTYFYRLISADGEQTRKMVLIR